MSSRKQRREQNRQQSKSKSPAQPTPQVVSIPQNTRASMQNIFNTADAAKGRAQTADGFDNFISRVGLNNDNQLSASMYTFNMITKNRVQLEAAYRGSWVVGVVVDAVAEDMTRAGINITTSEADEDIKDLQTDIARLQIWQSLRDLIKWGRLYGGGLGVVQIEGQDMSTPLRLETIGKDQFKGLVVFDRWQLNPDLTNMIDSGPNMGLPKFYDIITGSTSITPTNSVGIMKVHHSRVIRNIGIKLPYFQAITEMLWGESILERLWDRLVAFDNATMSSAQLIEKANLRMVGIEGLREIIAAGGDAVNGLVKQFEMVRAMQDNEGITLLDKNDEYQTTSYTFAGLSDMMLQFGQQLAGASGIPLVRLFGQAPAGLSSTGDSDIRMYYDNINAQQESSMGTAWQMLLRIMWRSKFEKDAPKDLAYTFNPLWQMSATDKATIAKTNAETVIGAYDSGLVSKGATLKELRESSGDSGLFNNISDEEIEEAELEPPPMPETEDPVIEEPTKPPVKNLDSITAKIKKLFKG